jgi:hypothetical protein
MLLQYTLTMIKFQYGASSAKVSVTSEHAPPITMTTCDFL